MKIFLREHITEMQYMWKIKQESEN
jgi:hypothetical protein